MVFWSTGLASRRYNQNPIVLQSSYVDLGSIDVSPTASLSLSEGIRACMLLPKKTALKGWLNRFVYHTNQTKCKKTEEQNKKTISYNRVRLWPQQSTRSVRNTTRNLHKHIASASHGKNSNYRGECVVWYICHDISFDWHFIFMSPKTLVIWMHVMINYCRLSMLYQCSQTACCTPVIHVVSPRVFGKPAYLCIVIKRNKIVKQKLTMIGCTISIFQQHCSYINILTSLQWHENICPICHHINII